ncbi:HD domain-containing protein [Heliobacterium gestii]|uniref:HD domain-containing protein n=1 Tax=Heliomicrobium gestii TaxID=2699 RepID=A0A845LB53_HELGE|nr:HD-GYP domain-containing protein [Heliomicrobium gestii]MBM7865493.1 HD-GYP domain-containing protein (c-di-GMP phosphodiesterase class II) [Heliomicrobium gestii]MZP41745.1 HD domain-containing protein [Heliomicrobium gestii]
MRQQHQPGDEAEMASRFLPVERLQKGMTLAGDIRVSPSDLLLCSKGDIVNSAMIHKLRSWGIEYAAIEHSYDMRREQREHCVKALRQKVYDLFTAVALRRSPSMLAFTEAIEEMAFAIDRLDLEFFWQALAQLKGKDGYTFVHCLEVGLGALLISKNLGFKREQRVQLCLGATLHDIGKLGVPQAILTKPGALTAEEFTIIKNHPAIGVTLLQSSGMSHPLLLHAVDEHHERYDGAGYPHGRHGDQITLAGQITAVADVFYALTSDRPYRKGWCPLRTFEYIHSQRGVQFSREAADALIDSLSPLYLTGMQVLLSDGSSGTVEEVDPRFPHRPSVRLGNRIVDLRDCPEIAVISA